MIIDEEGIDLSNWKERLDNGQPALLQQFTDEIISRNLRNSVFVDVTANADVADIYPQLLEKSISVVDYLLRKVLRGGDGVEPFY